MLADGRLMPISKPIADFRRDTARDPSVCTQFVTLCRQLHLFTKAIVAIDAAKFKAVNNREKFTTAKVEKRMEQLRPPLRATSTLGAADHEDTRCGEDKTSRLKEKVVRPQTRRCQSLKGCNSSLDAALTTSFAHRSSCPFDGNQRQGHRHCRL